MVLLYAQKNLFCVFPPSLVKHTRFVSLCLSSNTHTHTRVTHIPSCASKFRHTKSHIYIYIYITFLKMECSLLFRMTSTFRFGIISSRRKIEIIRNERPHAYFRAYVCTCVCMYVCVSECMLWVHAYASSHVRGNSWRKIAGRVFVIGNINWQLQTLKRNNQLLNYSTKYFLHK